MSAYRIDEEIGRGGMAVVYAGWDDRLERPVALKVLAAHLADDPDFRRRFLREAKLAARLHHPNVVRVYDITEIAAQPTIVMELLRGGTLEKGHLTVAEAAGIADALAHAHGQGIIHRDLKPANLLRGDGGLVKIADFGIARALEETMVTQIGTVLGTLRYLSPEQAEGRPAGPEADVYSLGVVLDELLEHPARGVRALIRDCVDGDPSRRPTAAEVASALRDDNASAPTRVLRGRERPRASTRRLPFVLGAGAAAAVVAAAAIAIATVGGTRSDSPSRVTPVPRATDAPQQARNLAAWLERYSR